MSIDASRSIVLTLHPLPDLDERLRIWLDSVDLDVVYSSAVMASPVRDGGQVEQVIAMEGLDPELLERLVADLGLDLVVEPFLSHR